MFSIIGSLTLRELSRFGNALGVPIVWRPYRITPSHWLMARTPPLTHSRRQLILANAPSTPQISLPSQSGHTALLLRFFWPQKRICLPQTRSPNSDLSHPPLEVWCASSFFFGLAIGERVGLSPSTVRPFTASGPRVRRHSRFSPTAYGPRANHLSVQHFTLHHPKQGCRGLSFVVEGLPSLLPGLLDTSTQECLPLHDTLLPLSHFIHEWERLPGVSLWVLRTVRSGYTLQFGRNPPRFDGVQLTVVNSASKASVLQQELSSLLQKGAIEEIPQSDIEQGFFSRYFLVPKRDSGLRPILDLRHLNFSLYKGKFKMLTMKTIMSQIKGGDWFVTIDLKDAYFHIQVIQRHKNVYEMHGCCTGPFEVPGH